jgi:hypothetical protein
MIEDDFESTGDIRKDYMAWSELMNRTPRTEIIYGIHLFLHRYPNEDEENDINSDFVTNQSSDDEVEEQKEQKDDIEKKDDLKAVKIEEFAELEDEEIEKL